MSQPSVILRMPLFAFLSRCRAQDDLSSLYHVVDDIGGGNGLEHFGYAFADKAAADAYHAGLAGFVSSAAIDASNSRVIRSTDAAYVAGLAAGASISLWDPVQHGPLVALGVDSANVLGLQNFARIALGRDPVAGGVFQWEHKIYSGGGGGAPINIRPMFGMVNAAENCTTTGNTNPLGASANAWSYFLDNPAGINGSKFYHNNVWGTTWDGLHAGDADYVIGLVYNAAAKTLAIYRDGVLKDTEAGVGANGSLHYPAFGSLSGAGYGGQSDFTIINTRGSFAHAVGGATPWNG